MANITQRLSLTLAKLLKLKLSDVSGLNLLTLNACDPWIQKKIMKRKASAHD